LTKGIKKPNKKKTKQKKTMAWFEGEHECDQHEKDNPQLASFLNSLSDSAFTVFWEDEPTGPDTVFNNVVVPSPEKFDRLGFEAHTGGTVGSGKTTYIFFDAIAHIDHN
jgi:hypothetical protein